MSSTTHQIVLTARDNTQQAFSAIQRGAEQDARALQQMGQQGSASLKQVDQAATGAASSAEKFNRAWAAAGAVAGVASGLLSDWSRSAQDAAAIQRQLEQAIANTGHSFDEYADQIQAAQDRAIQLGIDDEKAAQAIQALTEITGSASTALSLLGTAEDLSAAKGMDLVSAAELIGKVHEGNTGILQRYGIVVEQGASAEEALAQIQQQTAGQAEAHATTYARLREELSNVTDSIGGAVGGFAPFLSMLPGLSVGVTAATSAIGALIPEMTAAGAAATALDLALGPVGLVLAAGAAAVAVYELTKAHHEESAAAKESEDAITALVGTLNQLNAAASPIATTATNWTYTLHAGLVDITNQIDVTKEKIDDVQHALELPQTGGGTAGAADAIAETREELNGLRAELERLNVASAQSVDAEKALNDILNDTGVGTKLAQDAARQLFDQYAAGQITIDRLVAGIIRIGSTLGDYDRQANQAVSTTEALAAAQDRQAAAQESQSRTMAEFNAKRLQDAEAVIVANDRETDSIEAKFRASLNNQVGVDDLADAQQRQLETTATLTAANTENAFSLGTVYRNSLDAAAGMTATAQAAQAAETNLDKVARGSTSAAVQLAAFKEVQDGILQQESVFSQQASEYSQQVNAMSDARDILIDRQNKGIELTKQETDFLANYDEANARATAGVEDATVQQGILAEQYALNMEKGDQLNSSLDGVSKTTGELTSAIELLIASLLGVPPETVSNIVQNGDEEAINNAQALTGLLNGLDGRVVTTTITNTINNVTNNITNDVGSNPLSRATGGLVTAAAGRMVTVNEGGQETATLPSGNTVWLPTGSTVWPHAASVEGNRGGGGRAMAFYHATINVYANDPQEFAAGIQAHQIGWSRR